jgi:hypothetical protein
MSEESRISYRVDAADRIEAVSESWSVFARENWGEALLPPSILGRSLWDSISDPTTREIYAALLARVRGGRGPVHFQFRCDSPAIRRLLDMRITRLPDGAVEFSTTPVSLEPRTPVAVLDPLARRSAAFLVSCAWCARLRVTEGEWVEVEEAMRILDPFEQQVMPRLSHGMCPDCFAAMTRRVA